MTCLIKIAWAKCVGQEGRESNFLHRVEAIEENMQLSIAGFEFVHDLTAGAARRCSGRLWRTYGDGEDGAVTEGGSGLDRDTLSADGQTVAGVLDIDPGNNVSVSGEHSGSDRKAGVWNVGVSRGASSRGDQACLEFPRKLDGRLGSTATHRQFPSSLGPT